MTEMYPRIPWELVADRFGSAGHNLGTFLWREKPLQYLIRRFWSPRKHTESSFNKGACQSSFWQQ